MDAFYNTGANTSGKNTTSMLFYAVIIIFIGLIALVIIHYTYKPVFGKSSILSGGKGELYWEEELQSKHATIKTEKTAIGNRYCNYSLCFDMIIDDPISGTGTGKHRPLFYRGNGNDASNDNNNFVIVLDKDVNDLHVMVKCSEDDKQSTSVIVVENLPTQREFTIGFVLSESFMEVYLNGRLYKTASFGSAKLMSIGGDFKPSITADITYARIKRLRLWEDIVDTETMYAYSSKVSPSFTSKGMTIFQGTCGA